MEENTNVQTDDDAAKAERKNAFAPVATMAGLAFAVPAICLHFLLPELSGPTTLNDNVALTQLMAHYGTHGPIFVIAINAALSLGYLLYARLVAKTITPRGVAYVYAFYFGLFATMHTLHLGWNVN